MMSTEYRPARVLVVDDNREATGILARLLGELGCDVSYTFDPRLALLLARKCRPEIAFLDLRMPHMTGLHLASAFRAEKSLDACALVALTGYVSDYRWATLSTDFAALLTKPLTLKELATTVEKFVPRMQWHRDGSLPMNVAQAA